MLRTPSSLRDEPPPHRLRRTSSFARRREKHSLRDFAPAKSFAARRRGGGSTRSAAERRGGMQCPTQTTAAREISSLSRRGCGRHKLVPFGSHVLPLASRDSLSRF